MKNKESLIKNEEGFTLIEVIAVLIILGILAAVAVPKYFDLATEAQNKAWTAALTEAKGIVTLAYSKASIVHSREPTIAEVILQLGATPKSLGDFTCTFAGNGEVGIFITIKDADGNTITITDADGNAIIQEWIKPVD